MNQGRQAGEPPLTAEEFVALVERAGLHLGPEELAQLQAAFEPMRDQLRLLHSFDLGTRDPAVEFGATQTLRNA